MADIVRGQIAYPEAPMPPDIYRGQDAKDVALYVAQCAGNPSCGVTAETAAPTQQGANGSNGHTSGGSSSSGVPKGAPKPDGKQVFASAGCGGCHTLKAAGSSGNVGPNLDQLKPSEPVVQHQVEVGGGAMPAFKGRLSDAQIKAVAQFVSSSAGK
jgi:mono/diheme cytochrome c family protein